MPTLQHRRLLLSGSSLLPFSDDFARSDGALGNGWNGATWTISGNKVINTPTLGSELFTNGDFAVDANWAKGTGWTIATGVATHTGASASLLSESVQTSNRWYKHTWDISAYTSGSFFILAGANTPNPIRTAAGSFIDTFLNLTGAGGGLQANSTEGSVDNMSLKQITTSSLFASRDFGRADVDMSVKVTIPAAKGLQAGLVMCLDSAASPANFIVAYHDGTSAKLYKCVAGTYTSLISSAATYSAGATLRVTKSGSTFALYYNSVKIGADQTVSDVGIISNTLHGMFNANEGNSISRIDVLAN